MFINPYLSFDGCAAEALEFYARVLNGKVETIMTYDQAPGGDMHPQMKGKVMHGAVTVGTVTIMGSDAPPAFLKPKQGFSVSIAIDAPEEAETVFAALSEGGVVTMPIAETFWAHRFGMLTDRFGTPWMVNCAKPM